MHFSVKIVEELCYMIEVKSLFQGKLVRNDPINMGIQFILHKKVVCDKLFQILWEILDSFYEFPNCPQIKIISFINFSI